MTLSRLALTAALLAAFFVPAAEAQQLPCAPRAEIVPSLQTMFGEQAVFRGVLGGNIFELFLSASGDWTGLVTRPDMLSCFLIAGEGGEITPLRANGGRNDADH